MIPAKAVYGVTSNTFPLYVPVFLGYASVKRWSSFTSEQCKGINKLVVYFILPIFAFDCVSRIDPFHMSPRFLAADAVSKAVVVAVVVLWAKCSHRADRYGWCITGFSLCTQANTLVLGVPLLGAMYGKVGEDLIVQAYLLQALVWLVGLLFVLEVWKATSSPVDLAPPMVAALEPDAAGAAVVRVDEQEGNHMEAGRRQPIRTTMKVVVMKMATNPNSYASIAGMIWTLLSNRWQFTMPSLVEGSITILSKACGGMAMFSMGIFMALQPKFIACGPKLAILGMVMKFMVGPAAMAIASIALGLRGTVLRVAIVQAALPEAIIPFIYAKEYDLHPDVLSTAVIFGTLVFLPVLIAYYLLLDISR